MDVQDYTPSLYDRESRVVPSTPQTHPDLPNCKDDNMMLTECPDRSFSPSTASTRRSSSSSTNSPPITSSDEDQPKSARREVVEAEADGRKLLVAVGIVSRRSKGNSSQLQSCSAGGHSVCRSKQAGTGRRPPSCPSSAGSNTTIAGDSSDGLSVKLKMPRLSSMPTTTLLSASFVSARRSRGKEGGTARKSRLFENHAVTSTATGHSWPFHGAGKDANWRHYTLPDGDKDGRPVRQCSRHRLASGPCDRYTVSHRKASVSRSPSSRTSSSGCLSAGYRTSDSGEDLANDEQSDFPADEWPPMSSRLTYRLFQPTPVRVPAPRVATNRGCGSQPPRSVFGLSSVTAKHSGDIRAAAELHKVVRAPASGGLLSPHALEHQQMDPELEAIIDNTWPMLSSQAKAAYLRGVSQAGLRSPPARWHSSREAKQQLRDRGLATIQFVPSVLVPVNTSSVAAKKPAIRQSCSKLRHSMPTPPWELEDMEEEEEDGDDLLGQSLPEQSSPQAESMQASQARRFSDTGHNPTVDNWNPTTLPCSPLSETNVGHQMLRRLGWRPGIGLGVRSQGILTPVGCSLAFGLTCDSQEAETR